MASNGKVFGFNFGQGESELDRAIELALKHHSEVIEQQGKTTVPYVTSQATTSDLRVRDEKGDCVRILYGLLPSQEIGCIYEKVVMVPPDVTDDAGKIIDSDDLEKYPHQFKFHICPGEIRPDDVRLCYGKIAEMYAKATAAPAAAPATEPEKPVAKKHNSIVDAPVFAQKVIELNGSKADPDAEYEEIDVSDLVEEDGPPAQAVAEKNSCLDDVFSEKVCKGITRIKLAEIDCVTKPGTDEAYSYITTETAMLTVMAGAFDDFANVEYDKAIMLSDGVAFDFGSRDMLRPYEKMAAQPITKEQQKALVDRLKAALAEQPEEKIKATAKAILPRGRIYTALAEFFNDNKESLLFYQLDKPDMDRVLGGIIPEKGTIAVYCYDEEVIGQLVDAILRRRKATKFRDAVDAQNHTLKVNGWRVHFVGQATKQVFSQYIAKITDISDLGDLLIETLDGNSNTKPKAKKKE